MPTLLKGIYLNPEGKDDPIIENVSICRHENCFKPLVSSDLCDHSSKTCLDHCFVDCNVSEKCNIIKAYKMCNSYFNQINNIVNRNKNSVIEENLTDNLYKEIKIETMNFTYQIFSYITNHVYNEHGRYFPNITLLTIQELIRNISIGEYYKQEFNIPKTSLYIRSTKYLSLLESLNILSSATIINCNEKEQECLNNIRNFLVYLASPYRAVKTCFKPLCLTTNLQKHPLFSTFFDFLNIEGSINSSLSDAGETEQQECQKTEDCELLSVPDLDIINKCLLCKINDIFNIILSEMMNVGVIYVHGQSGYGAAYFGPHKFGVIEQKKIVNPLLDIFNIWCIGGILSKTSKQSQEPFLVKIKNPRGNNDNNCSIILRHYLRGIYIPLDIHRLKPEEVSDIFKSLKYIQDNHPEQHITQATASSIISQRVLQNNIIKNVLEVSLAENRKVTITDYGSGKGELLANFLSEVVDYFDSIGESFTVEHIRLIDAEEDIEGKIIHNFRQNREKFAHYSMGKLETILDITSGANFLHDESLIQSSTVAIISQVFDMYFSIRPSIDRNIRNANYFDILNGLNDTTFSILSNLIKNSLFYSSLVQLLVSDFDSNNPNIEETLINTIKQHYKNLIYIISKIPGNSFEILCSPYYYSIFIDSFSKYNYIKLYSYNVIKSQLPYEIIRILKKIAYNSSCVIVIDRIFEKSLIRDHLLGYNIETIPLIVALGSLRLNLKITCIWRYSVE